MFCFKENFSVLCITHKLANLCILIEPDHVAGNAELEEKARLTMKSNFRSSVSIASDVCNEKGMFKGKLEFNLNS